MRAEEKGLQYESMNTEAELLVNMLLENPAQDVEVEYNNVDADGMPHVTWLLRSIGSDPTAYIAQDIAHSQEDAERASTEKARLLGVRIAKVVDRTPHRG